MVVTQCSNTLVYKLVAALREEYLHNNPLSHAMIGNYDDICFYFFLFV
jgi:hypothetical protein